MSWLDTLEDIRKRDFSRASMPDRDKAARDVVNMASYACAVVAVSPIPFSDAVLMLPVQSAMVMTIGHIYGRKLTQADAKDLILELGTTAGVGMLARQGIKALLPVVGALLTVPAAFGANWGIGRVAMEYFRSPGLPREQLKKIYESAREEGGKLFSRERFERFRTRGVADPEASAPKDKKDGKKNGKKKKAAKAAPTGIARTIEEDFSARLQKHPEVREAIAGVIHLDIRPSSAGGEGGTWTVDLRKARKWISAGLDGDPKLVVRCSADTFGALIEGRKNAQVAVMSGELALEPMDLDLAMKLGPLFS